jgi:hypothetical protein
MSKNASSRPRRIRNHDQPIIITNESTELALDGNDRKSYTAISSSHYRGVGHRITSVHINGTLCNGLPAHGRFTIRIQGRHETNHDDSPITVVNNQTGIDITFNGNHYQKTSGGARRKKHKSNLRKVRSVTITDDRTGSVHDCSDLLPSPNTKFDIEIEDRN